jgi:hypothetical protein
MTSLSWNFNSSCSMVSVFLPFLQILWHIEHQSSLMGYSSKHITVLYFEWFISLCALTIFDFVKLYTDVYQGIAISAS